MHVQREAGLSWPAPAGYIMSGNAGRAFWSQPFRPFFLAATLYAIMVIPTWLVILHVGWSPLASGDTRSWHSHEMLFGYLGAVLTGFVLTALPNWTGRPSISGLPLQGLFGLWIAGRVAMFVAADLAIWSALVDTLFLLAVAGIAWREIYAAGNRRNYGVSLILGLFALANFIWHAERWVPLPTGLGQRMALALAAMLISVIGGRIIPAFTRNWMTKRAMVPLPTEFAAFDKVVLAMTAMSLLLWVAWPTTTVAGALLITTGVLHFVRLSRWRGLRTGSDALVAVLHIGYAWLAVSIGLLGLSSILPELVPPATALHALTAGAIGMLTMAVMSRASLGHSGRPLTATPLTIAGYACVCVGAGIRVFAPILSKEPSAAVLWSGVIWTLGFVLFLVAYRQIFLGTAMVAVSPPDRPVR